MEEQERTMATSDMSSKGQAWFCASGSASDVVVEVEEMCFHLHKIPLMSRSGKLHRLIKEKEEELGIGDDGGEIEEMEPLHLSLLGFPGGAAAFEAAAKFCYGAKVELTAATAAPLLCAAAFLEMTAEFGGDGDLFSRCERFLSKRVLRRLRDSVEALKSCERLIPTAEELGLVDRCVGAIAARAAAVDPGWPVNHRSGRAWFESMAGLSLPMFTRAVAAMRDRGLSPAAIEGCLLSYARVGIPGRRSFAGGAAPPPAAQRPLLEAVAANLPPGRTSGGGAAALFGLLRACNIVQASPSAREALARKIAAQLETATLDDLLIPSYSYQTETLYDVDCAERIIRYFAEAASGGDGGAAEALPAVGKLVDAYLAEIASDGSLAPGKFSDLARALPARARVHDDGLYRAVDVYLKAHPLLTEEERESVCDVMDCQKLTLEACAHAAQNDRLPLRAAVQVLFFEQQQLRRAIAGTLAPPGSDPGRSGQVLRLDMDSMRSRVVELERECSAMKKLLHNAGHGGRAGWGSLAKKFGCKFKMQVCDSHEGRRSPLPPQLRRQQSQDDGLSVLTSQFH
ncbi:BTB/POZ domain-containing protein At5g66560-like [Wolffia australiana]